MFFLCSYLKNNLKLTANTVILSAVIEGTTIIFIISLIKVGFIFRRNESADIIRTAIIVRIMQVLM